MDRVRRAGRAALVLVVALAATLSPSIAVRPGSVVRAATVDWPASSLVVSEVQTGGASASDEFVEIANQGPAAVDLNGLEVIYATSSGSTTTRKGTWSQPFLLDPGRRTLLVNGAGSYAGVGDAVYTGGFAATGGAVILRVVGGSVVDAIGWGMRRTRSSRVSPHRHRPPGRVSSGDRADLPATAGTATTTPPTGWSTRPRRRRAWPRHRSPTNRPPRQPRRWSRPRPRPSRRPRP